MDEDDGLLRRLAIVVEPRGHRPGHPTLVRIQLHALQDLITIRSMIVAVVIIIIVILLLLPLRHTPHTPCQ
jgi:hypothetical protein